MCVCVLSCAKGCGEDTELAVYKNICSDIGIIYNSEYDDNHYIPCLENDHCHP